MGINNINPNFEAVGEIEDELVKNKIRKEAELWTELYEKYQPENLEQKYENDNMGYGYCWFCSRWCKTFWCAIWCLAFAGLDALFQTFSLGGSESILY